jgi:hypothetical protein
VRAFSLTQARAYLDITTIVGFFWLSQIALGEGERMESPMKENLPSSDQFDALLQVCHTRVQLQKNKSHHSCEIAATSMLLMFTDRTSEKIGSL